MTSKDEHFLTPKIFLTILVWWQFTYIIKFGDIYVTPPAVFEVDGTVRELYPHEARLRSLTYSSPVYIDIQSKQYRIDPITRKYDPADDPASSKEMPHEFLG